RGARLHRRGAHAGLPGAAQPLLGAGRAPPLGDRGGDGPPWPRAARVSAVTIARQLGAGGGAVADRLAAALGWRLLDRALVERIAAEMNVAPEQVEACDERTESFVERLGLYLSEGFPEVLPIPVLPPLSPERTARAARRIVSAVAR